MHHPKLEALVRERERFPIEAYEFIRDVFSHAGADQELTARQLLEAISELARQEFGHLAATVFRQWGVRSAREVGEIVADLMQVGLIEAGAGDAPHDFHDAFDLETALAASQVIDIPPDDEMGLR